MRCVASSPADHPGERPGDRRYACAMPSIGPLELGIVLLIVLIVFGPKRLPGLGRQLGSGMREFKDSHHRQGARRRRGARREPAVRQQRGRPRAPPSPRSCRARRARRTSPPRARTPERHRRARLSRLRPIGHEDRLSLVEHLDELRTRLIACVARLPRSAFRVCYWQNGWLLDTINKPLQTTQSLSDEQQQAQARSRTRPSTASRPLGPSASTHAAALAAQKRDQRPASRQARAHGRGAGALLPQQNRRSTPRSGQPRRRGGGADDTAADCR